MMSLLRKLIKICKNSSNILKSTFGVIVHYQQFPYFIEKFNTEDHTVVIRCRGTRAMINTTFVAAISDSRILSGLSPAQACLLGGFFGRALRSSLEKGVAFKAAKKMSFLLVDGTAQYKIIFEHRSGNIGYINKKTGQQFVEDPLTVVRNEYIISQFDSSQACYIGVLAGIRMEKAISFDQKTGSHTLTNLLNKRPKLRIVE